MKRSKNKKKGQPLEPPKVTPSEPEPLRKVDLGDVGTQIISLVGNSAVSMVNRTIAEAENGHYLAMKCLFELIGLCPATASPGAGEEDSLARTLLQRLRIPGTDPGNEVIKE